MYKFYIVRSCCRINTLFTEYTGKHHSSGAALSLVPTALVTILAIGS